VEETPSEPAQTIDSSTASDVVSTDDFAGALSTVDTDTTVDQEALDKLRKQQQKYKIAAVAWKKAGNKEQALEYVKTVKQFDIVIAAVAAGEKLDLSDMPPTPTLPSAESIDTVMPAAKQENEVQQQVSTDATPGGMI